MATHRNPILRWLQSGITRRRFVQATGGIAAGAALLPKVPFVRAATSSAPDPFTGVQVVRTTCMMCNAGCGIQVRVKDGVALRAEGNPYCPHTNDYTAAAADVVPGDLPNADVDPGSLCPRGQASVMTLYDPLRLTTPLKRTGSRGSGQWEAISWEQAIHEIAWGGVLPDGVFQGLGAIRDVTSKFGSGDTDYAADAKAGDPANYGWKSNQLVMLVGRDQTGEATNRFMNAFGSINRLDHTSICNASYKGAGYVNFCADNKDKGTYNFKPDIDGATYLVLFGTNPVEANAPTNGFIRKLAAFKRRAGTKLVVVDPRLSNTAAKADWWIKSIQQGTDAALALGICRWLIDNNRHAVDYLRRPHSGAPNPLASTGWTDATFLVNQTTHKNVTAKDAGLLQFVGKIGAAIAKSASPSSTSPLSVDLFQPDGVTPLDLSAWPSKGNIKIGSELFYFGSRTGSTLSVTMRKVKGTKDADHAAGAEATIAYVVAKGGTLFGYHQTLAGDGLPDLEYTGTLGADTIETSFTMLKASLDTVANYAAACGVSAADIATLAGELSAPGVLACADLYRGPLSNTNGFYTVRAIYLINVLLDRIDRKGGYCVGKRYGAGTPAHTGFVKPTGVRIDRATVKYEGVPADPTRPWYPLAYSGVQQEVFPSIKMGYPYPVKALITFTSNPAYTMPYNHAVIDCLTDRAALPLHVSVDIFMSETAALADYVLPDVSFLEKWAGNTMTGYATIHTAGGSIRQPVVGSVDPATKAYTPAIPGTKSMDDILIALGKELGLPGYGADAMGAGKPLDQAWQFYNEVYKGGDLAMTTGLADPTHANLVTGGKRKNPAALYDATGNFIIDESKYKNIATIYSEWVASYKHSYTHEYFSGLPIWEPPHKDAAGNVVVEPAPYSLILVNWKAVQQVQSRSTSNVWLREVAPENPIWIHPSDASARGVVTGDRIRIRSPEYAALGRAFVTEAIQPGCVGMAHSFGRWQHGAKPFTVDGEARPADKNIGRGTAHNPLVRPDPVLGDVCLTDPVGGSAEFYSTRVAIERA